MLQPGPTFELKEEYRNLALGGGATIPFKWFNLEIARELKRRWIWIFFHGYDEDRTIGDTWFAWGHLRFFLNESEIGRFPFAYGTTQSQDGIRPHFTPTDGGSEQPVMRFGYNTTIAPFVDHFVYVAPQYFEMECDRVEYWQERFGGIGAFQIVRALRIFSAA